MSRRGAALSPEQDFIGSLTNLLAVAKQQNILLAVTAALPNMQRSPLSLFHFFSYFYFYLYFYLYLYLYLYVYVYLYLSFIIQHLSFIIYHVIIYHLSFIILFLAVLFFHIFCNTLCLSLHQNTLQPVPLN